MTTMTPTVAPAPVDYATYDIAGLASVVRKDWKKVYFGAVPYLSAMFSLCDVTDPYGADSGPSVVRYFLSNATTWRGPVAKAVKAELKKRVEGKW